MNSNFYKTYFEAEKNHWWFRVRRNIVLSLIRKYKILKTAKIFDFGCGSGYLVGELQKQGYDASGSDISQEAVEFSRQKGVRSIEAVESGEMPQNGPYDAILALDVIEHIKDDSRAIIDLKRALKPGGLAIITVPAYQWMWGAQDEASRHYRRYTISGLIDVIKKTGNLKIIHKTYFNTFLFLPIAVVRILSKWFNLKERESDFDINSRFLSGIFYFIFNLEAYFLNFFNFPFGVSILLVLKKE